MLPDRHSLTRHAVLVTVLVLLLHPPELAGGQGDGGRRWIYRGSQRIGSASLSWPTDSEATGPSPIQVGHEPVRGQVVPEPPPAGVSHNLVVGSLSGAAASLKASAAPANPAAVGSEAAANSSTGEVAPPVATNTLRAPPALPPPAWIQGDGWIHIRFVHAIAILAGLAIYPLIVVVAVSLSRPGVVLQNGEQASSDRDRQSNSPRRTMPHRRMPRETETASVPFANGRDEDEAGQHRQRKRAQHEHKAILDGIVEDNVAFRERAA